MIDLRIKIPFTNKFLEIRSGLANPESWLVDWFGGGTTAASGVKVTEQTAMQTSAVFACVRVLAETVASLPLQVYRRLPAGGKDRDVAHKLYTLLHDQPNAEMTSFELWEMMMGHLALWGNAYVETQRNNGGQPVALWPLRPDKMKIDRDEQGLLYEYTLPDGGTAKLRQRNIMHIRGLSGDGMIGYSPIRLAREAVGLALATEEFGSRFFGQGAVPSSIIERPAGAKWSPEAKQRFREDFEAFHSGLSRAHRLAILEDGMTWKQVGVPPEDAQFLALRHFQIAEIARIFRVPLHLVNETDKAATYASVEQFQLQFVVHTIRPWLVRLEKAFKRDLFLPAERGTYFAEFLVDGLLRGDYESRHRAYATGRQWGWMSADDVREKENMNPLPNGQGKMYLVPLNMVPAETLLSPPEENALRRLEQRNTPRLPARARRPAQYRDLFLSAADRLTRWEISEIEQLVNTYLRRSVRDATTFNLALEKFYAEEKTVERMQRYMRPTIRNYADVISADVVDEIGGELPDEFVSTHAEGYTQIFVRDHIEDSRGQLAALAVGVGLPDEAITTRLDEWRERRPGKIADWETVAAAGVFARYAMKSLGVTKLRWVAAGRKPCPFCTTLDGNVVGIEQAFALGDVQAEGQEPMRLWRSPRNPPLHLGCQCMILKGD